LTRGGSVLEAVRRFPCNRFFIADHGQTRANAPVLPATGLQAWPGNGSFRSASGIMISELRPIMGTRRRKGRNSFAFLCRFENWRFLIAPELTLETLESLTPPPVDVAFLSRIDSSHPSAQ
jgi:hypothetical protein